MEKILGTIGIARQDHQVVNWHFCQTFIGALQNAWRRFGIDRIKIQTFHGSWLDLNRVKIAHKTEGDFLLFIDTDMTMTPTSIVEIIERRREADILCGEFYEGQGDWQRATYKRDGAKYFNTYEEEVDACGMAFTLINKDLLVTLNKVHDGQEFFKIKREDGTWIGGDIAFCERAKKVGATIKVLPIKIGHIRPFAIHGEDKEALT